jgi:hypothetical protein
MESYPVGCDVTHRRRELRRAVVERLIENRPVPEVINPAVPECANIELLPFARSKAPYFSFSDGPTASPERLVHIGKQLSLFFLFQG